MKKVHRDVKEHPTKIINCKKKERNTTTEKMRTNRITNKNFVSCVKNI